MRGTPVDCLANIWENTYLPLFDHCLDRRDNGEMFWLRAGSPILGKEEEGAATP